VPPKAKEPRKIPTTLAALDEAMTKRYGDRVARRQDFVGYETISTGSFALDMATRVGGWIEGRMHEIVGPPDSGKSTLAINSMAEAQKKHPKKAVAYIDIERTFDWDWAEANGLNTDSRFFKKYFPDGSEDVSDQIRLLCETGLISMIVVDSVGGMESSRAMEKDAIEDDMRNAKIITRMVKATSMLAERHNVAVLFNNQPRSNVGGYGDADISAGPKSFRHSTSIKVDMRRIGAGLKMGTGLDEEEVGVQCRARITRSKVGPSGRAAEFWIMKEETKEYGPVGINRSDECFQIGVFHGVIERPSVGYYLLPTVANKIHGEGATKAYLRAHPDIAELVRQRSLATKADEVTLQSVVAYEPENVEAS